MADILEYSSLGGDIKCCAFFPIASIGDSLSLFAKILSHSLLLASDAAVTTTGAVMATAAATAANAQTHELTTRMWSSPSKARTHTERQPRGKQSALHPESQSCKTRFSISENGCTEVSPSAKFEPQL